MPRTVLRGMSVGDEPPALRYLVSPQRSRAQLPAGAHGMFAETNFAALCPDVKISEWCLAPPGDDKSVCCGQVTFLCSPLRDPLTIRLHYSICPNTGISGLAGHISLAFTTLASIAAIAIAPSSAPVSLLNTLIQADAYAIVLVGYTLTGSGELDFFHAGYALLLAFSSLIPLTAIGQATSDRAKVLAIPE